MRQHAFAHRRRWSTPWRHSSQRSFVQAFTLIWSRSAFIKTASVSRYAAKVPTSCSRATSRSNTPSRKQTERAVMCVNNVSSMMHRANLQRVDRCSMRFQLEIREPFLDQSVVGYASGLDRSALLEQTGDAPVGKAPLRALYDLYPSQLPTSFVIGEKCFFMKAQAADVERSGWLDLFEAGVIGRRFSRRATRICRF